MDLFSWSIWLLPWFNPSTRCDLWAIDVRRLQPVTKRWPGSTSWIRSGTIVYTIYYEWLWKQLPRLNNQQWWLWVRLNIYSHIYIYIYICRHEKTYVIIWDVHSGYRVLTYSHVAMVVPQFWEHWFVQGTVWSHSILMASRIWVFKLMQRRNVSSCACDSGESFPHFDQIIMKPSPPTWSATPGAKLPKWICIGTTLSCVLFCWEHAQFLGFFCAMSEYASHSGFTCLRTPRTLPLRVACHRDYNFCWRRNGLAWRLLSAVTAVACCTTFIFLVRFLNRLPLSQWSNIFLFQWSSVICEAILEYN